MKKCEKDSEYREMRMCSIYASKVEIARCRRGTNVVEEDEARSMRRLAGDIGARWPSHPGSRSPPRQIVQVRSAVSLQADLKGCEFATLQNDIYSAARGRAEMRSK